ncbi:MAG: putative toxin-antitoxin system toxin component, PIN family, partial [Acidobacteriaceae bacterium]|nr:putative toxin-antitoxin system toxin component, PIN family [Acidobacteriaceae bacterium]
MKSSSRFVIDTNVLVSRVILPASIPAQAVRKALQTGQLLMSDAIFSEIARVLARAKFDRYVTAEDRREFLQSLFHISEFVMIVHTVQVCRDPKDNMLLELAVNGQANFILTGDDDLLALGSFHGVPIWTP